MPRITGEKKDQISISISHSNTNRIDKSIKIDKEFSSVSDAIDKIVTSYYENKDKTVLTKEWLLSNEGRAFIKTIAKEE